MTSGKEEFAARSARIAARGVGTKGTVYVGQNETFIPTPRLKPKQSRAKEIFENALYPAGLAGAFLLGMFAVAFGRYVRFQVLSGMQFNDELDMIVNGALGLSVAFVLSQMFRLNSKEHIGLQTMGVFAMVCSFHNLVHWMPGIATQLFSQEWVADMRANTAPNSIIFRGATFLLTPPADRGATGDALTLDTSAADAPLTTLPPDSEQNSLAATASTEIRGGAKFISLSAP